jgi:hypothetical protein
MYFNIQDVSPNLGSCRLIPTLEPGPQPHDPGSLLESISSLRMKLASVTASAFSLSRELVAALDDLRMTTAIVAASSTNAVLAAQASAFNAISSAQASAASTIFTTEHSVGTKVRDGVLRWEYL